MDRFSFIIAAASSRTRAATDENVNINLRIINYSFVFFLFSLFSPPPPPNKQRLKYLFIIPFRIDEVTIPFSVRSDPVTALRGFVRPKFCTEPKENHREGWKKVLRELVKIHCVNNNGKNKKKKTIFVGLQTISYSDFPSSSTVALEPKNAKGPIIVIKSKRIYVISVSIYFQIFTLAQGLFVVSLHFCICILLCTPKNLIFANVVATTWIYNNKR